MSLEGCGAKIHIRRDTGPTKFIKQDEPGICGLCTEGRDINSRDGGYDERLGQHQRDPFQTDGKSYRRDSGPTELFDETVVTSAGTHCVLRP